MKQKHIASKEHEFSQWALDISDAPREYSFVPFLNEGKEDSDYLFKHCLISERCPGLLRGVICPMKGDEYVRTWISENPRYMSQFAKIIIKMRKSRYGRIGR